MNFKYAIFDLDGTLFNSTHIWSKVDEIFLGEHGLDLPNDYVDKVAHCSLEEAAVYTKSRFNLFESIKEITERWHSLVELEYKNYIQTKPFAKEFLQILKGKDIKMAVATGLPHSLSVPALKRLGLIDYFSVICSVDDVKKGKDNPALYLYTAQKLMAKPSECIVFEDVLSAIKSAKTAGMTVCAMEDSASKNKKEIKSMADYYISSWEELIINTRPFK